MYNFYLKLFVIFGSIVFVGFYFYEEYNQEHIIFAEDSDRNENSTPRSFVLPATPAVALDQEARNSDSNIYKSRISCMKRLSELNYDVGDELIEFNAKLKVAIYEFQKSIKLEPTGILDSKTIEALGC